MNLPKELVPDPKITYITPSMKFNYGTLKYEPVFPKKLSNKKLEHSTKIKIWLLGFILVLIILSYASLLFF